MLKLPMKDLRSWYSYYCVPQNTSFCDDWYDDIVTWYIMKSFVKFLF